MRNSKLSTLFIALVITGVCSTASYSQSTDLDKQLGADAAKQVASEMGIYTSEKTSPYIKQVGERLIGNLDQSPFEYQFHIVDMDQPNAFALPAGYIYITRGLLCLVNNEDELAGILGHEITHSELRHSVKKMRSNILPALLQIPGAIVGSTVNESLGQMINAPLNAGSHLFLASYSRKHEKQADKGGTRLMAAAGYDPVQFQIILDRLSSLIETITGHEEEFSYFDSHPYTPKRIKYLHKEIEKIPPVEHSSITSGPTDFLQKLDGIIVGDNPAQGVFQENRFLHPGLDLFVSFPEGWVTDNQPTMVGAIDTTDNKSLAILAVSPKNDAPEALGKAFVERLQKEHSTTPERAESINLNGMPAYLVSLKDNSGGEVIGIYSLWFRLNEVTFQMIGLAKESNTDLLRATALSIRQLKNNERKSIHMHTLRIREALEGESIADFNGRTGNAWNAKVTAVMNHIDAEAALEKGQHIKIAVKERYIE